MNQTLWNEFLSGKAVVNCRTENQAEKLFRQLREKGLKWADGKCLERTHWNWAKEATCYGFDEKELRYGTWKGFEKEDINLITYKQLMEPEPAETTGADKHYMGWEILKMIEDGKLKEGDTIVWHNGIDSLQGKFCINSFKTVVDEAGEFIDISYFCHRIKQSYFTAEHKEVKYLTFDKARHSGKKFKLKTWECDYKSLSDVLATLYTCYLEDKINSLLDQEVWEVEK